MDIEAYCHFSQLQMSVVSAELACVGVSGPWATKHVGKLGI